MNEIDAAVARMKAYIEARLREPITLAELARAAGYSQYHAARIFKEKTGLAPFEYIRRERLQRSAHVLRGGNPRVLDVALDFVFDSHEGFTRAFTKAFGITPKKYASRKTAEGWLVPFSYRSRSKQNTEESDMDKTAVVFTQIIERPARKLILKRAKSAGDYFEYCEEFGCADDGTGNPIPAEILSHIKEALYEQVGVWLPDNMRPEGTGIYASAVEVPADYSCAVPEGFDVIDLAPCKMLVFQGEPFKDEDYGDAIGALWAAIDKFNPEVYGFKWAPELAPRMQLAPEGWRGYIELRPICVDE